MKTYPMFGEDGARKPVFQIENVYAAPSAIARVLAEVAGVTAIRTRKPFSGANDEVHVEFSYRGEPFIVWEPFGDNSRYWIGPSNHPSGIADVAPLEEAFKRYQPPLHRRILGDLLTLRWLRRTG